MLETQKMQTPSLSQEGIPWRKAWQPTPVFLPGESHGFWGFWGFPEEAGELTVHRVAKSQTWLKWLSLVQFSCSVVSDSWRLHGLQHTRSPYPSPTLEFTQTHVHWVSDAIQPSHPLLSPSPPAFNLSQHQGLFKWVSSVHQVAIVLDKWG